MGYTINGYLYGGRNYGRRHYHPKIKCPHPEDWVETATSLDSCSHHDCNQRKCKFHKDFMY